MKKLKDRIYSMNDRIDKLVDDLFSDTVCCLYTAEMKNKIYEHLEKEYQNKRKSLNENQAFGKILLEYGTLSDAAALAGYSREDILRITKGTEALTQKDFKKKLHLKKFTSLLLSLFIFLLLFLTGNYLLLYRNFFMAGITGGILVLLTAYAVKNQKNKPGISSMTSEAYRDYIVLYYMKDTQNGF